jgi:serine protease Do
VSAQGQNIGFAIPINVIKASIDNFNATGKFERPFLGVAYRIIPEETALLNNVPQGAYLVEVVPDSPASKAGLQAKDIITSFGGVSVSEKDETNLALLINKHKVGDRVQVEYYRNKEKKTVEVILTTSQ